MDQSIDFPTRGDNILDLVISDRRIEATALPHLGTSEHINVFITVDATVSMPEPPIQVAECITGDQLHGLGLEVRSKQP